MVQGSDVQINYLQQQIIFQDLKIYLLKWLDMALLWEVNKINTIFLRTKKKKKKKMDF